MRNPVRLVTHLVTHPRPARDRSADILTDRTGAVLIEAALALPLMIVVLMAVVAYGSWMLTAQSLQQVANDAARSALGGLSTGERRALATRSVDHSLLQAAGVSSELVSVAAIEQDGYFTVRLTYDGSRDPLLDTTIIPLPSTSISRSATIEIADF